MSRMLVRQRRSIRSCSRPRPLLVSLYHDEACVRDLTIAKGKVALAMAFFGMLGITMQGRPRSFQP